MDNIDNIIKITDSLIKLIDTLIWPLVTIALGFMFRGEIRKMLMRINKFKYKDLEATFEKELSKIEHSSQKLPEKVTSNIASYRKMYDDTYYRLIQISDVSPRAAISEAWRELELATSSLMIAFGYQPNNVQMSKVFRNILYDNEYPSSIYQDYKRLRDLRNKAVHAEDFEISQIESERYIRTALDIAIFIKKLSNTSDKLNSSDTKNDPVD